MKRARKTVVVAVFCVLVGLPVICSLTLYATAWYYRLRAERLLGAVKSLRVGSTTEAEYERAIRPFVGDADRIRDIESNQPLQGAYGITTLPEWMYMSFVHLPESIEDILGNWAVIEGTVFEITPTFKDGRLIVIRIAEYQGTPRPFGGFVTIHAGRVDHLFPDDTEMFPGYSGRPLGGTGRIYTHVDMDDRATSEERRRALDFRFSCFTAFRLCSDGRQLLDPVTTSN